MNDIHRPNINTDTPCEKDELGFDQYVDTISAMVTDKKFNTPFCIGLFGKWGVGKTSFMTLLQDALKKNTNAKPLLIPVWFNPWRYEKETHLIIPFFKTIEKSLIAYAEKQGDSLRGKVIKKLKGAAGSIGRAAAAIAYGMDAECKLGGVGIRMNASKMVDREEALKRRYIDETTTMSEVLSSTYYDIICQLENVVDETHFRIVVFIDDLDRCMPEKAVELLEAIKLFLDIKGFLFVLGVDRKVIQKGIEYRYRHFNDKDDNSRNIISATDYLEKMIQLPIELPPVARDRKTGYIKKLLGESMSGASVELIAAVIGDNPRNLKRFTNLLAFQGRWFDTVRNNLLSDKKVENKEKELVEQYFTPPYILKWTLYVFLDPGEPLRIAGNPERLFKRQEFARLSPEEQAESKDDALKNMDGRVKIILASNPPFPENEWVITQFVYNTPVSDISAKYAGTGRHGGTRLKPGDMVPVPAGKFIYQDDHKNPIYLEEYSIDAFPVTNRQYQEFLDENKGYAVPYMDESWSEQRKKRLKPYSWNQDTRSYPKGKGDHPVVLISIEDAEAFCNWRSKKGKGTFRLPNEKEWEKAARGVDGREYPWGNDFDSEKCNTEESGIGQTTEVIRYPEGRSPYDVYDMAGNVWEWTGDYYNDDEDEYTLRGGSWYTHRGDARCATRSRLYPDKRSCYIGFRCVRTET